MRLGDAKPSRYRRRLATLFFLLLALFAAGGVAGQQQRQATPLPPELRGVNDQLTGLTKDVARTISESFSFCVADP
jgi:hypothetical protein